MNLNRLEFTNHETYFEIAREQLQKSQSTDSELESKVGFNSYTYQGKSLKPEDVAYLLERLQIINQSNIITVVFTALAAESFINYYALSKGKDEAYLTELKKSKDRGKLSETVFKWIKIPKDITKKVALTENSAEVHNLQKLFNDRNKLAHHKASIQNLDDLDWSKIQDPNIITLLDAQSGYQSAIKALEALKRIDQTIDITWLADKPIAELRPIPLDSKQLRPFGLCAGEFTVPDDFDAPLPEDILSAFEGK